MNDLISRQAAIDAMANAIFHYPNELYRGLNQYEAARELAEIGLSSLSSAQSDEIYEQGWKDGQNALKEEIWERERDRCD